MVFYHHQIFAAVPIGEACFPSNLKCLCEGRDPYEPFTFPSVTDQQMCFYFFILLKDEMES